MMSVKVEIIAKCVDCGDEKVCTDGAAAETWAEQHDVECPEPPALPLPGDE